MKYGDRMTRLARRKGRLIAASTRQRAELAAELAAWRAPVAVLERGIAAARFVTAHPVIVAAAIATVAVLGRRRLLRWAGRALLVWRSWRTLRTLAGTLVP